MHRNLQHDFISTENTSYGRTLPLMPHPDNPPPEEHIYAMPTTGFDLIVPPTPRGNTSSFSPNADVLPNIGTLKKKRYIDVKIEPNNSKPIPTAIPQPEKEERKKSLKEEFYDEVFDDSFDESEVEEVYDEPSKTDLGRDLLRTFEEAWSQRETGRLSSSPQNGSGRSSMASGSTGMTKVTEEPQGLEAMMAEGEGEGEGGNARNSAEVAKNPLYDKLKHDRAMMKQ